MNNPGSKHLPAIVKECRDLLERDFANQCHQKTECSVKESALAFLLELAIIRCFEEQIWKISSRFRHFSNHEQIIEAFTKSHKLLQAHLPFPLQVSFPSECFPKSSTLKIVLSHFIETIAPEEWRSEHILGWLYQSWHENTPEQKQHGQFYTPEPIADYIVAQALELAQREGLELFSSAFSVLDLACGCGAFALRAFEYLYKLYQNDGHHLPGGVHLNGNDGHHLPGGVHLTNIPQHILENHLFLIDNDPWACRIAAINLYLKAKGLEPECRVGRLNICCADALQRWEQHPPYPPQGGNSTSEALRRSRVRHRTLHPLLETPTHSPLEGGQGGVFDSNLAQFLPDNLKKLFTRKYDVVVGNPPYIVINQLRTPKEVICLYESYQSAAFKINTFALFVERGIELLKPNGILGMIVPNTFLTQLYFEPLRQYILKTSKIRHILDTKRLFDNAFVENGILLLQREPDPVKRTQNVIECNVKSNGKSSDRRRVHKPKFAEFKARIPQVHFEKAPFDMFNVYIDKETFALLEKIANGNPKLGEICESHDGVNPGNVKRKLIVTEKVDETCRKVLNGKNIGRYWVQWGGLYVRYNRSLIMPGDNMRWGHQSSLDSAKILTRQTADRLIGTFDHGEYYVTNSIHTTILRENVKEFHLKYLLALLNSKLLSFYYRKLFYEVGQLFSQVKLVNLRQLPVKQTPMEEQKNLVELVDALLRERKIIEAFQYDETREVLKRSRRRSNSDIPGCLKYLADVEARWCRFREIDDKLDHKVYELYQLTPAEIQPIQREMGSAVCLYPKVAPEELKKTISFETFEQQYCHSSQTIFQMAEYYRVHPESILALRKSYGILRERGTSSCAWQSRQ